MDKYREAEGLLRHHEQTAQTQEAAEAHELSHVEVQQEHGGEQQGAQLQRQGSEQAAEEQGGEGQQEGAAEHEQRMGEQGEEAEVSEQQERQEQQEQAPYAWERQQIAPAGAAAGGEESEEAQAPSPLQGKTALVLDASTPLGAEIAVELACAGAHVLLAAPDIEDAFKAAKHIQTQLPDASPGCVEVPDRPLRLRTAEGPKKYAELLLQQHLEGRGLDLVVNNAAAGVWRSQRRWYTDKEGVGGEAQADFMAPYILLRCLEPKLLQSHARIVNVVSPLNRCVHLPGSEAFLFQWLKGSRLHAQLANVLLAAELQRRLGRGGVQACVVDAGIPSEQVLGKLWLANLPPIKQAARLFWTPSREGATTVLHAAIDEWPQDTAKDSAGPNNDLRYYASGLLTSPLITKWDGSGATLLSYATWPAYTSLLLLHAALAHSRLHRWLRRKHGTGPRRVKAARQAYDEELAADLWEVAGLVAGIEEPGKATRKEKAPEGHGACVS